MDINNNMDTCYYDVGPSINTQVKIPLVYTKQLSYCVGNEQYNGVSNNFYNNQQYEEYNKPIQNLYWGEQQYSVYPNSNNQQYNEDNTNKLKQEITQLKKKNKTLSFRNKILSCKNKVLSRECNSMLTKFKDSGIPQDMMNRIKQKLLLINNYIKLKMTNVNSPQIKEYPFQILNFEKINTCSLKQFEISINEILNSVEYIYNILSNSSQHKAFAYIGHHLELLIDTIILLKQIDFDLLTYFIYRILADTHMFKSNIQ